MKNQKGFTLIELMIVVAIIAILAAIAISQYQDYVAKSQFSEAPSIVDGLKTKIVENFTQTGACPTNSTVGFSNAASYAGKYVASVAIAGTAPACTITVTFKPAGSVATPLAGNNSTVFTGTDLGGTFQWRCASGIAAKYLPKACQ